MYGIDVFPFLKRTNIPGRYFVLYKLQCATYLFFSSDHHETCTKIKNISDRTYEFIYLKYLTKILPRKCSTMLLSLKYDEFN